MRATAGYGVVPGELLPAPLSPSKTPRFSAQQAEVQARKAKGDKEASGLDDEISVAVAAIADNPCLGYRMRGLPTLQGLCAYHFPTPFKRWRVVYRYTAGQGGAELIVLGEHWKSIGGTRSRSGPSSLSSRLRFADVYEAVNAVQGPVSKTDLKRTRKAVGGQEKERCCRRTKA